MLSLLQPAQWFLSTLAKRPNTQKPVELDCDLSAGIGVIVGMQQDVACVFNPSGQGQAEAYVGRITEVGFDIGKITKAKMAWLVYAPVSRQKAALAGTYVGATADAAVGHGLGANVLVGGGNGTISLQPISVKAEDGLNVAVGVAGLTLRAAK